MKIICDTHVLLFWADAPDRLSRKAKSLIREGMRHEQLACADISLWEITMLANKGRITPQEPLERYLADIITAMALDVLPITPGIAVLAQSAFFDHQDPADRLIAATALHHQACLITRDEKLRTLPEIDTAW